MIRCQIRYNTKKKAERNKKLLDKRIFLRALVTEKSCPGAQMWLWRVLCLWQKTVSGSGGPAPDSCSSGAEGLL